LRELNYIFNKVDKVTEKVLEKFSIQHETAEFDIHDGVIIGLLEDILGKIKSLNILIEAKSLDSIDVVMRSAFEGYVYLSYILKTDTKQRARAYAYKNEIEEIKLFEKMTEKNKSGKKIRDFLGQTREDVLSYNPQVTPEYIKDLHNKYENLFSPKEMKKNWFDFDNKTKNIEQLCIKLEMEVEYNLIYRLFPKDVHSSRALSRLQVSEQKISVGTFEKDSYLHKSLASLFLMEIARAVLTYYDLQNELKLFNMNVRLNHTLK